MAIAARAMVASCLGSMASQSQAFYTSTSLSMRATAATWCHSFVDDRSILSNPCRRFSRDVSVEYSVKEEGEAQSLEYRVFFLDKSGKTVSPWHDIPLHAGDGLYNFIVEIPKETKAKMEVATCEPNTPIKQDTEEGDLCFYPYNINWNYGLFPQTWKDPARSHPNIEDAFGDNNPVDVVEIGERQAMLGEVLKVKPLGVFAMIDQDDIDWKVVAISIDDPKADLVNNVADVEKHFPGTLVAIRDWFKDYKISNGKPANQFGFENKVVDKVKMFEWTILKGHINPKVPQIPNDHNES